MDFWNRVFGFVKVKMPAEPKGDYQTGGILLRVFGWLQAVGVALSLLMMLIVVPIVFVIAAAAGADGAEASFILPIIAIGMAVGLVLGLAFAALWMFWIGFILERWAAKDERGLVHARIFAIVQLALTVFGVFALVVSTVINTAAGTYDALPFGPGFNFIAFANPMTWVQIGGAIWLLVLANRAGVESEFDS